MNYRAVILTSLLAAVGCGGAPFTIGETTGALSALPDSGAIMTVIDPPLPVTDAGAPDTGVLDAGTNEEPNETAAAAATDTGAPIAVDGGETDGQNCAPASPYMFGCAPLVLLGPANYCAVTGGGGVEPTSQAMPTPSACLCNMTCACITGLIANGANLCPAGQHYANHCELAKGFDDGGLQTGELPIAYGIIINCVND
jgi:hypothetical protein